MICANCRHEVDRTRLVRLPSWRRAKHLCRPCRMTLVDQPRTRDDWQPRVPMLYSCEVCHRTVAASFPLCDCPEPFSAVPPGFARVDGKFIEASA